MDSARTFKFWYDMKKGEQSSPPLFLTAEAFADQRSDDHDDVEEQAEAKEQNIGNFFSGAFVSCHCSISPYVYYNVGVTMHSNAFDAAPLAVTISRLSLRSAESQLWM